MVSTRWLRDYQVVATVARPDFQKKKLENSPPVFGIFILQYAMDSNDQQKQPGPKPDHLNLDGEWEGAVSKALKKQKPKEGWPEPEGCKGKSKDD